MNQDDAGGTRTPGETGAYTHCEACGAVLTAKEQAEVDPRYYVNCHTCQTSRF